MASEKPKTKKCSSCLFSLKGDYRPANNGIKGKSFGGCGNAGREKTEEAFNKLKGIADANRAGTTEFWYDSLSLAWLGGASFTFKVCSLKPDFKQAETAVNFANIEVGSTWCFGGWSGNDQKKATITCESPAELGLLDQFADFISNK